MTLQLLRSTCQRVVLPLRSEQQHTHMVGDELLLHVSPNSPVDDLHKTNYYGSEARKCAGQQQQLPCDVDHVAHIMCVGTAAGGGNWAAGRSKGTAGGGRLSAQPAADSAGDTSHPSIQHQLAAL
jgi:hypothetical protein